MRTPPRCRRWTGPGITGTASLPQFVAALEAPRVIWLMLPAAVVDQELTNLKPLLAPGDVVIDGGNSYYRDDMRRGAELEGPGLHYLDVGTSGGIAGGENGYCLMIGGEKPAGRCTRAPVRRAGARRQT